MKPTLLLAAMGVALTGMFGYHAIYARQQAQLRVIRSQITDAQADQGTQQVAAGLMKELEGYRKRLAPEPDPSWLVRETMSLMNASGLQLTSVAQEAPRAVSTTPFTRLSISLQCRGTYHQVGEFVDRLERAGVFIKVETLDLAPPVKDGLSTARLVISTVHAPSVVPAGMP